jgi:hypothetical protein
MPRIGRDSCERAVSAMADLGCKSGCGALILWPQNPVSRRKSGRSENSATTDADLLVIPMRRGQVT